jgi:hypothetical protein
MRYVYEGGAQWIFNGTRTLVPMIALQGAPLHGF